MPILLISPHFRWLVAALFLLAAHSAGAQNESIDSTVTTTRIVEPMRGKSGKLRLGVVRDSFPLAIGVLQRLFGDSAVRRPGIYTLEDSAAQVPFSLVRLIPFSSKESGRVGAYRLGRWPAERRQPRSEAYVNPEGFIEVTEENQQTRVSEHFRLSDFLTHNQRDVWPKYLVLREALIDKLELILDDLNARGINAERFSILSGFRTPEYNAKGVRRGGRAKDSRHQYGDAADIFVDNNGDGRMDDLNRDGRVNTRDAMVLIEAVERVERQHPELVGGAGLYRANASHGPFIHVDVRGNRARWKQG
ncbi:MAG: hypothetical protein MNPFHGCM_00767 [Gemmatimonadaceae bacterium]|nr:hypothetical protein [Gemmatimonadaceae bacterium]